MCVCVLLMSAIFIWNRTTPPFGNVFKCKSSFLFLYYYTDLCYVIRQDGRFWSDTNQLTTQNITEFIKSIANTHLCLSDVDVPPV